MLHPLSLVALVVSAIALTHVGNAQSFYVDVTNSTPNAQFEIPTGYAHHPSYDYAGPGFSAGSSFLTPAGQGTYYIADGFLSGHTSYGLWQSSWLEALYPNPDNPPHGGLGTVDILTPGGIAGIVNGAAAIMANGLPNAPLGSGDTNDQYLGIGGDTAGSEYALWETALVVTSRTTYQYGYSWTPAGATWENGDEILPLRMIGMGAVFFLDNDTDYTNGIFYSEASAFQTYDGAGNQLWFTEFGTITLDPGTYYWGFATTGNGPASYIGVEGISMTPIPEPSAALLVIITGILGIMRRRRSTE